MVLTSLMIYYGFVNIALFVMMGFDKMQAIKGNRRVPEVKLFALAMAGGAIGGIVGMQVWHHKTRKPAFHFVFGVATFIHLYLIYTYLPVEL
mgnify:CR=1 FL=1